MEHIKFLKERFPGLAKSPEVESAARRTARRSDEEVLQTPEARIQNYLDRFKEIIERKDQKQRQRGVAVLKNTLIDRYVVRVEDIPENYWSAQMRIVRERGMSGDVQALSEEEQLKLKQEHLFQAKEDQKGSLEEWIDYLASERSSYLPDALKYWAFQGMLRLERYEKGDKEKDILGRFPKRPTGKQRSVKMFPEVNERALRFIADAYAAQLQAQSIHFRYDIPEVAQKTFLESLQTKDFRTLYGWGQEYIPPISEEEMKTTGGEWITYSQGSDSRILASSLQGKGSGWCIAGEQIAKEYLEAGDIAVYYTHDREGAVTIPRVVIVRKGDRVTEVRGIGWGENLDDAMKQTDIIGKKLDELPGGREAFEETDKDTKQLTAIDKKMTASEPLTRDELVFLYEIERPIKYFGDEKDPRIKELRSKRNAREDAPIVFECTPEAIAWGYHECTQHSKVYIGPLFKCVFSDYPNLEHIYTSFPEEKARELPPVDVSLEIIQKTGREIGDMVETEGMNIHQNSRYLLEDETPRGGYKTFEQTRLKKPETIHLVRLTVNDMFGDGKNHTTDDIYKKATDLGLELCPPEVGPLYRIAYKDQPQGEYLLIAMEQITGSDGCPCVFGLFRYGGDVWLDGWAGPDGGWSPGDAFVFRLRK